MSSREWPATRVGESSRGDSARGTAPNGAAACGSALSSIPRHPPASPQACVSLRRGCSRPVPRHGQALAPHRCCWTAVHTCAVAGARALCDVKRGHILTDLLGSSEPCSVSWFLKKLCVPLIPIGGARASIGLSGHRHFLPCMFPTAGPGL